MNGQPNRSGLFYIVGVLGALLIMAIMTGILVKHTQPESVGADVAKKRYENLTTQRAADSDALNNYAMQDAAKGVVRLPIQRAMEITLAEWKNPAAARSNLAARVDKATAAPPAPAASQQQFE
jgi:hypothetical protein